MISNKYPDKLNAWNGYRCIDITTDTVDAFPENLFRNHSLKENSTLVESPLNGVAPPKNSQYDNIAQ